MPTRDRDWTPAVLLAGTLSVAIVGLVWVTNPALRGALWSEAPGPERARRLPPPQVAVWAGDVVAGVKGVLAPVWGDPEPDRHHDAELNRHLALPEDRALAWYRLLLFNVSAEERTVSLAEGALTIRPSPDAAPVPLQSLPSMEARGDVVVPAGSRAVLEGLGALEERVVIPPGRMASLLVPFPRRVALEEASAVAAGDGGAFHRRPMARAELQDLLYDPPDAARLKDL